MKCLNSFLSKLGFSAINNLELGAYLGDALYWRSAQFVKIAKFQRKQRFENIRKHFEKNISSNSVIN
jgi:hypothetical protein